MNSHTFWELPKGSMDLSASNQLRNNYILNFKRKKYLYLYVYDLHVSLPNSLSVMNSHGIIGKKIEKDPTNGYAAWKYMKFWYFCTKQNIQKSNEQMKRLSPIYTKIWQKMTQYDKNVNLEKKNWIRLAKIIKNAHLFIILSLKV